MLTDEGKVEPLLAKSWDVSPDGTEYTFRLQSGVTFSDGAADGGDVVAALKRVTSDESTSARKKNLSIMKTIEAPDDGTVKVTLATPSQSFPVLSHQHRRGRHPARHRQPGHDGARHRPVHPDLLEAGRLHHPDPKRHVLGTKASNKQVVYRFFTDATAENNALLAGQLDLVTQVTSPDVLTQFDNRPESTVVEGTSTTRSCSTSTTPPPRSTTRTCGTPSGRLSTARRC